MHSSPSLSELIFSSIYLQQVSECKLCTQQWNAPISISAGAPPHTSGELTALPSWIWKREGKGEREGKGDRERKEREKGRGRERGGAKGRSRGRGRREKETEEGHRLEEGGICSMKLRGIDVPIYVLCCINLPLSYLIDQTKLLFWKKMYISNNVL